MNLTFLGAAGTVTGSKTLVTHEGKQVLVDCGLFHGCKNLRFFERGALMGRLWWFAGWVVLAAFMLAAAPLAALAQASADAMATQSSSDQGVTVKVTPKAMGSPDNRWEFAVVLDTHSADLSDDLSQSASLTTSDGRTLKPVRWTSAAADGHHREGLLAFDVPAPRPKTVELRILRRGESAPRTFRWQL